MEINVILCLSVRLFYKILLVLTLVVFGETYCEREIYLIQWWHFIVVDVSVVDLLLISCFASTSCFIIHVCPLHLIPWSTPFFPAGKPRPKVFLIDLWTLFLLIDDMWLLWSSLSSTRQQCSILRIGNMNRQRFRICQCPIYRAGEQTDKCPHNSQKQHLLYLLFSLAKWMTRVDVTCGMGLSDIMAVERCVS